MNNKQNINLWFDKFDDYFQKSVPYHVANEAQSFFEAKFKTQEWDGVKWKALSPKYVKKKNRPGTGILTLTRNLYNSIGATVKSPNKVVVSAGGANAPYARAHNEGLRIEGIQNVRGYTNKNFMGRGKPVRIKPHTRKVNWRMPERRFMGNSHILNEAIKSRLIKEYNHFKK